jgi:glycosyltransferase involved in cell wall biosynthesis
MNEAAPLAGKRVLVLVQNLPVPFDRRVWQESKSLRDGGASVTVVCPSDKRHPAGEFEIDGISVIRYRAPREASGVVGYANEYLVSLARMRSAVKRARQSGAFDVVHFCNPPDLLYTVAKPLRRRDGTVLVFDQHDLGPELVEAKHLPLSFFFSAVARLFESRTYAAADHVIATNESYRAIAMGRGRKSADRVTVIRSGPPRDWITPQAEAGDHHEGHRYLIGYLGVMGRQEGIEYLIDAVDLLSRAKGLDVQLALVGSGPDIDRLQALVAEKSLEDRIRFCGRVSDEDLVDILSDADVCVNPDEVNPMNDLSTMNKIVEYMALARPIVQFDVKEGRFSAGEASLYAERDNDAASFADAIERVLLDPELAESMSLSGRKRFEDELCWDIQSERLVDAYATLLHR